MLILKTNTHSLTVDYLDVADGVVGLRHPHRLGRVFIGQHLSAPEVISSEDDPVNEVLRLAGTWNWAPEQHKTVKTRLFKESYSRIFKDIYRLQSWEKKWLLVFSLERRNSM